MISCFIGRIPVFVIVLWLSFLFVFSTEPAAEEYAPTLNGVSLNLGYTYDPSDDIWFSQVSIFRMYDYDRIWGHNAPEFLRFKVEGSLGGARLNSSRVRMNASVNILALLYLSADGSWGRPYVEAGIGAIYTDYKASGQDYRFNFNPQAGLGVEMLIEHGPPCFTALRLHHLSNGGIGSSNRGQNSVVWLFGRYF